MKAAALILTIVTFIAPCAARIIYLDASCTGDYPTIQDAIDDANDGDVLILMPGIYAGPGNRDIVFEGKAITVRSQDGPSNCIIDCGGTSDELHRGFYFHRSEYEWQNNEMASILDGLKIINGRQKYGGAIYCNDDGPLIIGSNGPLIRNCVFSNNVAFTSETNQYGTYYYGVGGAIYCGSGIDANIVECHFNSNSAYFGGNAICCAGSAPIINKCTFTQNNGCMRGGAIYLANSSATVVNCLMAGNSSVEYGGAIACKGDYHTPQILQCTITGNSVSRGGALDLITVTVTITNCIFWGNSPAEIEGSATGTANVQYSNIQGGWPGAGNIDADPLFVGLGNYHLAFGSPCIDSGTNSPALGLPPTDLDGALRPLDGDNDGNSTADMGAYECLFNPNEPVLAVIPGAFRFSYPAEEPAPEAKSLYIWNAGGGALDWQITGAEPWLDIEPDRGVSSGEIDVIELIVDPNGLPLDLYECVITVTDACDPGRMRNISVKFRIGPTLNVPADYDTIQAAIDAAFDGDEIIVSNGTYTGNGNRDIDFKGKAITVRSQDNDPFRCIIDCEGSDANNHRGFYFHSSENEDSILSGFTIKNGYLSQGTLAEGGGIFCLNQHTTPTIQNCIVVRNAAWSGGGISCYQGSPTIRNCIVANNEAFYDKGGGVLCWDRSSAKIIRCTIAFNTAKLSGGGAYFYAGSPIVTNSILWGNNLEQIKTRAGSTLSVSYSDVQFGWSGTGNISGDPCFIDVLNQNYHLSQYSPCIDAGDPNSVPLPSETDIDGGLRKVGVAVDIGADELKELPTDVDEDGDVDAADLAKLSQSWITSHSEQDWNWEQDINQDGTIDFKDYAILAVNYGRELDSQCPSRPGNVVSYGVTYSTVQLRWDDSTDNVAVAGYRIYRNGSYLGYTPSASFNDSGVDPGSIYIYQVCACDLAYNESEPSSPCIVTTSTLN